MGHMVIAVYRPKPGKQAELAAVVREHVPILRKEGLATLRAPLVLRAKDGTLLEILEWESEAATQAAHGNANVLELWERFAAACDYMKLSDVPEAAQLFSPFELVEL